jgi:hypothetical protein
MTIGRYGSAKDDVLTTVLTDATADEMRDIIAAFETLAVRDATPERIADAVESVGTETARMLATWIRENGGWFVAASAVAAVGALLVAVLTFIQNQEPSPDQRPEIHIDKLIIHNDGNLTIPAGPAPSE